MVTPVQQHWSYHRLVLSHLDFINGSAQDCGNSSADALELPQPCCWAIDMYTNCWHGYTVYSIDYSWPYKLPCWLLGNKQHSPTPELDGIIPMVTGHTAIHIQLRCSLPLRYIHDCVVIISQKFLAIQWVSEGRVGQLSAMVIPRTSTWVRPSGVRC